MVLIAFEGFYNAWFSETSPKTNLSDSFEIGEEAKHQNLNKTEQKKSTGRTQLTITPDKVDSVVHPSTPNDSSLNFSELKTGSGSS